MADTDLTEGTVPASAARFHWGPNEMQTGYRSQSSRLTEETAVGTGTGESGNMTCSFHRSDEHIRSVAPIDRCLLDRAEELLQDADGSDPEGMCLALEALRCVASNLWTGMAESDQYHQSLLAMVEAFLLSREQLTPNQAAALRGAFRDLASPNLTEAYLDVIRSRFIDEGHKPMAILSDLGDADGDDVAK